MIRFKVESKPIRMKVERIAVIGEDSYARGYEIGYNDGNADGYTKGHAEGVYEGYNNGYAEGLSARTYETWTFTLADGTVVEKEVPLI